MAFRSSLFVPFADQRGQSLIELLVAIGLGAILFVGSAALIAPSLQINKATSQVQVATGLGDELLNNVRVFSDGNWDNLLSLATSSANTYYLIASSSPFTATSGVESIQVSTTTFTRSFYISDVYRDSNGNATSTVSGNTYDPSTKKISIVYNWTRGTTTTITTYLTRNRTAVTAQTDWSGGSGLSGPVTSPDAQFGTSTNINYAIPGNLSVSIPPLSGFAYHRTITVTSNSSIASGTLANFPMLVSSTVASWESSSTAGGAGHIQNLCTAPNGGQEPCDLVFATSSANCGTANLNFETESYTSSTGALVDWVNVPSLSAGTAIYACYDNASTTTDQSNPSNTWDSGYQGVWHLDEASGATAPDSTVNDYNATSFNYNAPTQGTGLIVTGQTYVSASDEANLTPTLGAMNGATRATLSGWYKRTATSNGVSFGNDVGAANSIYFIQQAATTYVGIGSMYAYFTGPNDTNWHYVSIVFDASQSTQAAQFVAYVDGTKEALTFNGSNPSSIGNGAIYMGEDINNAVWSDGSLDEIHISNVALSPSWILTEYNNQSSPGTFYTVGGETANSGGATNSGTISSSAGQHWAWNDAIGWLDFYNSNNVSVSSTGLHGYASSSIGDISLDCATTRNGNVCSETATSSIAYDNSAESSDSNSGTLTWSQNVSAAPDRILFVGLEDTSDTVSGVTFAGTTMTLIAKGQTSSSAAIYLYYLVNPPAGTSTVAATFDSDSGAYYLVGNSTDYTGAAQTGQPDNYKVNIINVTSSYNNEYTSLTTSANNAWGVVVTGNQGWYAFSSLPTVERQIFAFADGGIGDTATSTSPAGTMTVNTVIPNAGSTVVILASFAPYTSTSGSTYQVLNDGNGNLSGWAWNDAIGWISFCGGQNSANCPGTTNYETTIDSGGNFQGWAWNNIVGWISFNCDNNSSCGTSNYEVQTTWTPPTSGPTTIGSLTSPIFDTGAASGAQFNSILWQGTEYPSSTVQFQLAASNSSSGPWNYYGSDGTSNTYYTPLGPGDAINVNESIFNNNRYFGYKIFISATASSSVVNDVVVNWSP